MSATLRAKLARFDPDLPLEKAHTIPSSWYADAEIYAAECRAVFGNTWQVAGRIDQLASPGAFVTTTLAGEPILLLRDGTELRAFANVCRHRGTVLVPEPAGTATKLRCRYHGWTYDLAGRLRGAPEFEGVADFCRGDNGLAPLRVAEWGPFAWVHMGTPAVRLPDFLAPLPERAAALGLEQLCWVKRREYELACNWKVFVDNYLDGGHHVHTIHPGLAGALDYSQYRTEVFSQSSVQISPIKRSDDPGIAQVRQGENAYYWWVFPNLMINLYAGVMDTNLVLPLGPDRCRVVFDFYFASNAANGFVAQSIAVAEQVQREDIGICEEVQRGLASRFYDTGRFSVRREAGGYHFHQLLARQLGALAKGEERPA
jgi:choline monooxygenase